MDYSTHRVYRKRALIMAVLMIIIGIFSLQFRYDQIDLEDYRSVMRFVSGMALIIFGAMMFLPRFCDIMPAIGLMCLGIGLSRFLVGLSYAIRNQDATGLPMMLDNAMWVMGYIILIFSTYQLYRGFNFMRMDAMNAFVMRFSSMGIVFAYVLLLIYAQEFAGVSVELMWDIRRDFVTTPILYTMYFILLCSKEVFDLMSWERVRRGIHKVSTRMNPGALTLTNMEYQDFKRHYNGDKGWTTASPESPVECEIRFPLTGEGVVLTLLLEKWKETGRTYYTLIPSDGAGYIAAQRGEVKELCLLEDGFDVYNDRRLAFHVQVQELPPRPKGWRRLFGPNYIEEEEE